ncbi:MAG TPA: choice-of-anchor B family protein, partial [Rhodothermales bacterium]|nr:choice-of-anchor B family protein [Rhodothermales bacterium]
GGFATIATMWGWTDPQTGKEYAIIARSDGTGFTDVSNPLNPVYVGKLLRPAPRVGAPTVPVQPSAWHELKVSGNTLVEVSEAEGYGMQTFDLTRLRQFAGTPLDLTASGRYEGFGRAHNVLVSDASGLAVATGITGPNAARTPGCGPGLHFVNVSNPASPAWAGCYTAPSYNNSNGYTHDAQCVRYHGPDTRYVGKEICLLANTKALIIVDASGRDANGRVTPVDLGWTTYPNVAYAHQGWLTEDHRYFYLDDELDQNGTTKTRTLVFDVQDLTKPTLVTEFTGRTTAIDHNQYIRGRYAYQANYTAGLNILDVQTPTTPREVAYFDTYPANDQAIFGGLWNVYPYFASGTIVAATIQDGLFVLKPTALALSNEPTPRVEGFDLTLDGANPAQAPVRVRLALEAPTSVRVAAYDVLGREVATLFDGTAGAGITPLTFDATGLASGVYVVNARIASASVSRRVVVVR